MQSFFERKSKFNVALTTNIDSLFQSMLNKLGMCGNLILNLCLCTNVTLFVLCMHMLQQIKMQKITFTECLRKFYLATLHGKLVFFIKGRSIAHRDA